MFDEKIECNSISLSLDESMMGGGEEGCAGVDCAGKLEVRISPWRQSSDVQSPVRYEHSGEQWREWRRLGEYMRLMQGGREAMQLISMNEASLDNDKIFMIIFQYKLL